MKTIVTLKRFYFKRIEIEIDNNLLEGKTEEEIATFLIEEYPFGEEEEERLFNKAKLEGLEIDSTGIINEDTDRYDIYEDGKQVYGGHL